MSSSRAYRHMLSAFQVILGPQEGGPVELLPGSGLFFSTGETQFARELRDRRPASRDSGGCRKAPRHRSAGGGAGHRRPEPGVGGGFGRGGVLPWRIASWNGGGTRESGAGSRSGRPHPILLGKLWRRCCCRERAECGEGLGGRLLRGHPAGSPGRGLGAALTVAALQAGREIGFSTGVLQASEAGYGVHQRIGFVETRKGLIYV